jgi:Secretion system C-terminal sorting domain
MISLIKRLNLVGLFSLLLSSLPQVLNGQACAGTQIGISIENVTLAGEVLEFDVHLAKLSTAPLTFASFGGGVIGLPAGILGTPTIVQQASANGFAINNTGTPNFNATAGFGGVPLFRWASNPVAAASAVVVPTTSTKIYKFRFTRTGGTAFSGTPALGWQPQGSSSPPQIVSYCNGNPNSAALILPVSGTLYGASALLPLDLVSFEAKASVKSNVIYWSTRSERNTAWHVIERSRDGLNNWKEVGRVPAAGTSTGTHEYSLEDLRPLSSSFYRLLSVDLNGATERSKITTVIRRDAIFGVTSASPSPTADYVSVQFETAEEATATIQVFDFTGRMVLEQQLAAAKGTNTQSVNLTTLAAGVYSVQVRTETEISAQVKVVKQ